MQEEKGCRRRQTTIKEWSVKSQRTAEGRKKSRDHRERKHSWPCVCSYAVQFCWPPLHAPSPHHSPACLDAPQPPPMHLPLLLLEQPHYDCVSSDRPTTSYLSAGTASFMSAGHRFNTRPVSGMSGGLAGWWMACPSVRVAPLSDWTPCWRRWGHCREWNQTVMLGIPGCLKLFWASWALMWNSIKWEWSKNVSRTSENTVDEKHEDRTAYKLFYND